jgi:geranylgeranyl diphosphate/geranylgeranyl-bacteriochlorophyllide a reductase
MRIAIVGAGPAGSQCAATLCQAGADVLLFDPKGAWEKPCGGGVTYKALYRYPFLMRGTDQRCEIRQMMIRSPLEKSLTVTLDYPFLTFSRATLNRMLLDRAVSQGARFHQERVIGFEAVGTKWKVSTNNSTYSVDFLVGADGVSSLVRRRLAWAYSKEDLMMAYGYRQLHEGGDTIEIKFFPDFPGYLWVFPRAGSVSFGICGKLHQLRTSTLKANLDEYLKKTGRSSALDIRDSEESSRLGLYSALVPSLRPETLRNDLVAGCDWALIGDAAGFVDPITGEGIYLALRSGELLAEALRAGRGESSLQACQEDFLSDLIVGAQFFDRFYTGDFLGSSFIDRMVELVSRSLELQRVINAFIAGQQPYRTLRPTLLEKVPKVAGELFRSLVESSFPQEHNVNRKDLPEPKW